VPFCAHRCCYCDFTLVAGRDELIDEYLNALEIDLRRLEQPRLVETLFLGGGTPTHLNPDQLSRLVELLRSWFWLTENCEFSVEANPAGLTDEKLDLLKDAGVNRISLGMQSFDDELLKFLERDHRRADVEEVIERVRRKYDNFSLDLIFAVPGQSIDLWEETLETAIRFQPRHISTYGLTYEKGTRLYSHTWSASTSRRSAKSSSG
jgi:oxygen-independent coproporphyrinogen-3 oxidase